MVTCPNCGAGNAEGQRFCGNCGTLLEQARIEGERKFASFLFADVAHSTSIAEEMDPEDWTLVMNGAFGFMNAAVSRYGGTVSRLMGDAVLALFGAPVAHEDDAERAVRAALEIQESADAYSRQVKLRHGVDFRLRVGIHTGTAVLAVVGDAIKAEYTAMGDAANVAARLQSAAEPGTVLISADTQRLVRAQFDFKPRGPIAMKGKQAAVESYEVIGLRAVPGKSRGLDGLTSPIVGRDREIALLRDKLGSLSQGMGSVVAVIGEAGLGKSRLLAELREAAAALADGPAWYEARAISYGQTIPYFPWRQLGRQMIGAGDMESGQAVREKLAAFAERLALSDADMPFYETLLAVDTEESRQALAGLTGDELANRVAGAVVNAVKAFVGSGEARRPLVLVLDDLHWSDNATLELIAQVAALAGALPLMIVCILRPRRKAPSWQLVDRLEASLASSFERIDLEPLAPADAGALLGNLLDIRGLPDMVRRRILDRSEGNPFYLEEVLRSLIDCGQIVSEDGHWRATRDIVDAKIPETLAGVLSARIDRLPDTTKRVAQTAAVIGRAFMHRVLEQVCHAAPAGERIDHVEPHLASLSYEQLVRERARMPEREYVFKHALTCEAAYGLLLKSRRRDLHARTGVALEDLFADRREEMAAVLAHHFAEADDLPRALDYSKRAADNAGKLAAPQEELEHRDRILKLVDRMPDADPGDVIDAILAWTGVRNVVNDFTDVLPRLERAVELARAAGDERRLALALSWTGNIHMVTGFPSRSFVFLQESQALAEKLGEEQLMLLPLFMTTWFLLDRDPRAAADALTEVVELAHHQHALDVEGHAMGVRAIALARLGEFDEARKQIAEALEVAKRVGSRVKDADIHISASMAYYDMGEVEKGLEHARIGAEKALSVNGFECACAGFYNVGRGHLEKRELDKALSELGRSLKIAELASSTGMAGLATIARGEVAVAEFEQGTPDAVERLRKAMNEAKAGQNDFGAVALSQRLAAVLLKLDRHEEAAQLLETAIAYYRERAMRPYIASALELLADIREKGGRTEAAAQARAEAAELRRTLQARSEPPVAQPLTTAP